MSGRDSTCTVNAEHRLTVSTVAMQINEHVVTRAHVDTMYWAEALSAIGAVWRSPRTSLQGPDPSP